jgi:DNA polymerase III subunit delta
MRLKPEQLGAALKKGLAPVYFISGDEPLQLGELADAVRKSARQADFLTREVLSEDMGFTWQDLTVAADSYSIFADKKVIDLRLPSASPGAEGSKALIAYCERLPEDTLLLITAGKLGKDGLKTRWCQTLDKVGVVVQVWPLEGQDLIQWLQQRMQRRGLEADAAGIQLLASRIEGNLLAAAQEIEKLYVLYGTGQLSAQQISDVVADSSRYDVFKLIDSALSKDVSRMFRVLSGLQAEGVAAPVVLWALTRETRTLIKIKQALAQGQNRDLVFRSNQIWDKRKQVMNNALSRLTEHDLNHILVMGAKADRQIKGLQRGDAWATLREICLWMGSAAIMANTG